MAERLEQRMEKAKAAWVSGGEREWNEDKGVVDRLYKEYLEAKRRYDAALPVIGPERADIYYWQALVDVAAASPDRSEAQARFEAQLAKSETKAEKAAAAARARPPAEEEPAAKRPRISAELHFGSAEFEEALASGEMFTIEDHQLEWKDCPPMAKAASVLVEAQPEELDAGVQWTGGAMLPFDDDQVSNRGLATRECTRAIAEEVLKDVRHSERRTITVITGSPGIGKTRTLVHVAKRVLEGGGKRADGQPDGEVWATVLIFNLKSKIAYLIARRGGRYHAWSAKCPAEADSLLFSRSDVHVLVDPEEAKKGGAKFAHPLGAHLVLAASANEKHFEGISKTELVAGQRERFMFYAPSWTLAELQALRPKLTCSVALAEVVAQRFATVGGAPRYVFNDKQFVERVGKIRDAVGQLSERVVAQALKHGNISGDGLATIPGCFFTFAAAESHYDTPAVCMLSSFARLVVANHYRAEIIGLAHFGARTELAAEEGFRLEELARSDLVLGGTFTVLELAGKKNDRERVTFEACAVNDVVNAEHLGLEKSMAELAKLFADEDEERVVPRGRRVLLPCKTFPAIDFADSERRVFQVTTNVKHDFKADLVAVVLEAAGILKRTVTEKMQENGEQQDATYEKNNDARPIAWYWSTPDKYAVKWTKPRAITRGNATVGLYKAVQECAKTHLVQYVLYVPERCPRQGVHAEAK